MSISNITERNGIYGIYGLQSAKNTDSIRQISSASIFDAEKSEETEEMELIAHRGYSSQAPENTIPAFIMAAENGYDTVECDIEWTKDGVPVLLHDSTINRTARKENGSKLILPRKCSNLTYEQLLKYDFGSYMGEEFKGTKIPTLYELLDCGKENDLNLYLELKESSQFDAEKAQKLVDAVKEAGLEDKVTWISFNEDYLKIMSEVSPDARLGYLSKETPTNDTVEILKDLETGENEVFLDVKYSKISETSSKLLDEAGFDFEAWTVDDTDLIDDLYDSGCKAITTNTITNEELSEYTA